MARITVEDCLENVENRFELVMVAAKRARDLSLHGAPATLDWENDKATVLALREIAAGTIDKSVLDTRLGVPQAPQAGVQFVNHSRRNHFSHRHGDDSDLDTPVS